MWVLASSYFTYYRVEWWGKGGVCVILWFGMGWHEDLVVFFMIVVIIRGILCTGRILEGVAVRAGGEGFWACSMVHEVKDPWVGVWVRFFMMMMRGGW